MISTENRFQSCTAVLSCSRILILLYVSVKAGYNAAHNLHSSSWDTRHLLIPDQTIFYLHVCIVEHFCKKILSSLRNVHIIHILGRIPPKTIFRGDFLLVGENAMHVLDPFSFRSSHVVGRLITHCI